MTLVMAMSGVIHTAECRAKGRTYKCVAPEIDRYDIGDFLVARSFTGCGVCLRDLVVMVRA
jgi:hypothetical protein